MGAYQEKLKKLVSLPPSSFLPFILKSRFHISVLLWQPFDFTNIGVFEVIAAILVLSLTSKEVVFLDFEKSTTSLFFSKKIKIDTFLPFYIQPWGVMKLQRGLRALLVLYVFLRSHQITNLSLVWEMASSFATPLTKFNLVQYQRLVYYLIWF